MNIKSSDFANASILVVGDAMLDEYWEGSSDRISSEAPVPIVKVLKKIYRVGGAANVALNASKLGAKVKLLSLVGDDTNGKIIEKMLIKNNVQCFLQKMSDFSTIKKLRVISNNQQLLRIDFESYFSNTNENKCLELFEKLLDGVDIIILSDYAKGILDKAHKFISIAKKHNKTIFVDPKSDDFAKYHGVDLIKPNLSEFFNAADKINQNDELDIEAKAHQLMKDHKFKSILLTRSENGMSLYSANNNSFNLKAHARDVFDVTGAGDTVIATLAVSYASGNTLEQSVYVANLAASIVISKFGTCSVEINELNDALSNTIESLNKLISYKNLEIKIKNSKENGESIIMTNGCFDILHPGHVDYLEKAKALGNRLIVAINDDNSTKRLKGPTRPINNVNYRALMLSALKCVDWVISFSEDTPENIYKKFKPDILVKGGDYFEKDVIGSDIVLSYGGSVEIIDFLEGFSTTDIIKKIKKGK